MKKHKYKCSFNGRLVLALGVTYKFANVIVMATNEKEALLECYKFDKSDAEKWINTNPPYWATNGEIVKLTTPEQHLQTYGKSSGYTEYKGSNNE